MTVLPATTFNYQEMGADRGPFTTVMDEDAASVLVALLDETIAAKAITKITVETTERANNRTASTTTSVQATTGSGQM